MVKEGTDNDLTRLKLLSKGLTYALGIMAAGVLILGALMLLIVIAALVDPSGLEFTSDTDIQLTVEQTIVFAFMVAVVLIILGAVLVILMNVARAISREYSPFTKTNVRRLETVSLLVLAIPFVFMALIFAIIRDISAVDCIILFLAGLVMAAVFYMLALVFDYGCWLQKESDETL